MLVLSALPDDATRLLQLPEPLSAISVRLRHIGPTGQQRFHDKMVQQGVLKAGAGFEINSGRHDAFLKALSERYILGWEGDFRLTDADAETPEFSHEEMAKILGKFGSAYLAVLNAMTEESAFFSQNGDGSHG